MKTVAQVAIGLPISGPFDYRINSADVGKLKVGMRVFVPFQFRQSVGYVVGLLEKSRFPKLKSVQGILDEKEPVLSPELLKLTKEFSEYYGCSWGEAIEAAIPTGLRGNKTFRIEKEETSMAALPKPSSSLYVDLGTTARWPILAEKIQETLKQDRGVLFLVPEVSLLEKVTVTLRKNISEPIVVLDKRLTHLEELANWAQLKEGTSRCVIGTRSAVFAPVQRLGLIVVYDEENMAYKQDQSPFYHVRDVVEMRSRLEGCNVAYVTSAPSAETWFKHSRKKESLQILPAEHLAEASLIDLTNYKGKSPTLISYPLQTVFINVLNQGGKVVLFLNRRGFSTATRCNQCGATLKCERCEVNLSYVSAQKKMVCLLCDTTSERPTICPQCRGTYLRSTGMGIEKIESEIARIFPQSRVAIFDRDTAQIPQGANVIIATQAVLRVLDELKPAVIGVLEVDSELNRYDFRSAQQVFSLLLKFRQSAREKVIIQTQQIDNYCLNAVKKGDYKKFYKEELALRKEVGFPPFVHLVEVVLRGTNRDDVFNLAKVVFESCKKKKDEDIEVFDPQPDIVAKLRDKYRFTIMIKGKAVKKLLAFIQPVIKEFKGKRSVMITWNIDP